MDDVRGDFLFSINIICEWALASYNFGTNFSDFCLFAGKIFNGMTILYGLFNPTGPTFVVVFNNLSLAFCLWDIGKQKSPRCDAAERGVPSGAILFAQRNFIEKWNKI